MGEVDEVRQGVNALPGDLPRELSRVAPRLGHRGEAALPPTHLHVAAKAPPDGRNAGGLGSPRVLVAVLARDVIHARVHPMAEGNRLHHVGARRPRVLGEAGDDRSREQQRNDDWQDESVHRGVLSAQSLPLSSQSGCNTTCAAVFASSGVSSAFRPFASRRYATRSQYSSASRIDGWSTGMVADTES